MLMLMGIGGVIAVAIISGLNISNPLSAAISSLIGKASKASGLLNLFKKGKS